ncbi:hypothetical protein B7R22_00740 [Subtercola boreus]|uniref:Uncharacterized protein n=1 Tax=Subtercola boreus TaxID=120213 RepID=A0A3E0W555_9MICO|nr:hypothetical protein [Subtercola boreus]RFA17382.1 hypothetical protein B7R22_00740 [Subtercola boreus]
MIDAKVKFPGALVLVLIRTFGLWVYVPLGFVGWLVTFPWLVRIDATIGEYFGWLDINFCTLLLKTVLRPFVEGAVPKLLSVRMIPEVEHRIGLLDAY